MNIYSGDIHSVTVTIYSVDTLRVQKIAKGIQTSDLGQSYRIIALVWICCPAVVATSMQERVALIENNSSSAVS